MKDYTENKNSFEDKNVKTTKTSSVYSNYSSINNSSSKASKNKGNEQKKNGNGCWGPVYKDKNNFVDMHMF